MTAAYQQNGQLRGGGGGYSGERAPQLKRVGRGAGGSKATEEERKVRRRETEIKRNSAFNSVESSEGLPQCTHTHSSFLFLFITSAASLETIHRFESEGR